METLLRPMDGRETRLFVLCILVSVAAHLVLGVFLTGGRLVLEGGEEVGPSRLAERFAQGVNAATDLDQRHRELLEQSFAEVDAGGWNLGRMPETIQWLADGAGLAVRDCDVVRALDSERSREGRMDIRVWMDWGDAKGVEEVLMMAYLVGEGTLQSNFGSHRLWVHLETGEQVGRVAFETMDCRLFRAGKIGGVDLLHRAQWFEG